MLLTYVDQPDTMVAALKQSTSTPTKKNKKKKKKKLRYSCPGTAGLVPEICEKILVLGVVGPSFLGWRLVFVCRVVALHRLDFFGFGTFRVQILCILLF